MSRPVVAIYWSSNLECVIEHYAQGTNPPAATAIARETTNLEWLKERGLSLVLDSLDEFSKRSVPFRIASREYRELTKVLFKLPSVTIRQSNRGLTLEPRRIRSGEKERVAKVIEVDLPADQQEFWNRLMEARALSGAQ